MPSRLDRRESVERIDDPSIYLQRRLIYREMFLAENLRDDGIDDGQVESHIRQASDNTTASWSCGTLVCTTLDLFVKLSETISRERTT